MRQINSENDKDINIKSMVTITFIVGAFLLVTFLFTENFVISKTNTSQNYTSNEKNYIYTSETFRMIDKVYYVLFLDMSKYANKTVYNDILSKYETNPVYIVDLSRKVNQAVLSDKVNKAPTSFEELKLIDETLIKVESGRATKYIEKLSNITKELK